MNAIAVGVFIVVMGLLFITCLAGCLMGGGGGSVKSPGSSSSPMSAIDISLENSAICFLTTSCRLEFSLFA